MDAEIQFFMTDADEAEFMDFAQGIVDEIDRDTLQTQLKVGNCVLMYTPSTMDGSTLYAGKLEIRLGNSKLPLKEVESAQKAFRRLRNWIKKHYFSRLAYQDKNKNNKLTPSRVHWLGKDARNWKDDKPEAHHLKLSPTSWVEFEIGF